MLPFHSSPSKRVLGAVNSKSQWVLSSALFPMHRGNLRPRLWNATLTLRPQWTLSSTLCPVHRWDLRPRLWNATKTLRPPTTRLWHRIETVRTNRSSPELKLMSQYGNNALLKKRDSANWTGNVKVAWKSDRLRDVMLHFVIVFLERCWNCKRSTATLRSC